MIGMITKTGARRDLRAPERTHESSTRPRVQESTDGSHAARSAATRAAGENETTTTAAVAADRRGVV